MDKRVRMNLNVIYTTHLLETKKFYKAIGLEFKEEKHGNGKLHYSCTLNKDLVLEIYPYHQSNVRYLGFEVYNLRAVLEALGKYNLQRMVEFPDQSVMVYDPDSQPVHLSERK